MATITPPTTLCRSEGQDAPTWPCNHDDALNHVLPSPFLPCTAAELSLHEELVAKDRHRREIKMTALRMEEEFARQTPRTTSVLPLNGKTLACTNHTTVLCARTDLWCAAADFWQQQHRHRRRHVAEWPTFGEQKWEGDDRARTGFGRFPPLPRVPLAGVAWYQRPLIVVAEFDLVRKVPGWREDLMAMTMNMTMGEGGEGVVGVVTEGGEKVEDEDVDVDVDMDVDEVVKKRYLGRSLVGEIECLDLF